MSQSDYNDDDITWSIDRNPDYSILNQYYNILNQYYNRRFAIMEEPDDNYTLNVETMRNLTGIDTIYARDFINPIHNLDNDDEIYNNTIRNNTFLQNFRHISNIVLAGNAIFNPDDDFIPFNSNRSETTTPSINFIVDEILLSPEELDCCICMECQEQHQMCQLNCQHTFCVACIDKHLERNSACPLCREHISQIRTQTMEARHQIHH
jgi:hypothetical protein